MLVLSRKSGEEVIIDGNIRVTVVGVEGSRVRLGFDAPKRVQITRPDATRPHRALADGTAPIRVLVVDDSPEDREFFRRLMVSDGDSEATYLVAEAETAEAGLAHCILQMPDCVLLDYRLPDLDGLEFLEQLADEAIPVVLISGQGDESVAVQAIKHGAHDYLSKRSITRERLRRAVHDAMLSIFQPSPALVRRDASPQGGRTEGIPRYHNGTRH